MLELYACRAIRTKRDKTLFFGLLVCRCPATGGMGLIARMAQAKNAPHTRSRATGGTAHGEDLSLSQFRFHERNNTGKLRLLSVVEQSYRPLRITPGGRLVRVKVG